jgi:hypothetical protein
MKNYVNLIVITLSIVVGYIIYYTILGNPANFLDPLIKHEPKPGNVLSISHLFLKDIYQSTKLREKVIQKHL